jgi:hypothetical protein
MISKANIIGEYVNKIEFACYKSLETSPRKFMKLLGIASVIAIVGSDFFLFHGVSEFILVAKKLGPWMVLLLRG